MRKGQSVYFVFKDNEVLLDSQLRPRMYQSKETAEKNRYKWEEGAALVEYVPNTKYHDVVEVKHGRWVYDPDGMDWGLGAWLCSECRCRNNNLGMDGRINPLRFSGSKFCPHCGAKMDLRGKTNGKN